MSNSVDIKCKICDGRFETKPEYHKHKKEKHPGLVPRLLDLVENISERMKKLECVRI